MLIINEKDHFLAKIEYEEKDYNDFMKLYSYFSIKDPKLSYTAKVRSGASDGKIRFVKKNGTFLKGLISKITKFLDKEEIEYKVNYSLVDVTISKEEIFKFIDSIPLPFEPYEYQKEGVYETIRNRQKILLAATRSGKSMILYLASRYLVERYNQDVLIIVPDVGLTLQMYNDFKDYSKNDAEYLNKFDSIYHRIFSGQDKESNNKIIISTYQSIYDLKEDHNLFKKSKVIFADEAHEASSESYVKIFSKATDVIKRIGVTGTKPNDLIRQLKLEGMFGTSKRIVSARELIDLGRATETFCQPIIMKYNKDNINKVYKANDWRYEQKFIIENEERFNFLISFVLKLAKKHNDGNILVLYKNTEYGVRFYEELKKYNENTFLMNGKVKGNKREEIRNEFNNYTDSIIVGQEILVKKGITLPSLAFHKI